MKVSSRQPSVSKASGRLPVIYSFVVDAAPRFASEGYHLAVSLMEHCGSDAADIHVHVTPEVPAATRELFSTLGCRVHPLARFGDGRYGNKIAQLENLLPVKFDRVVLLDTDMLVISDVRPYLREDALLGKVVDVANPSPDVMRAIAAAAGVKRLPPLVVTDTGKGQTYPGNCNGGFYCLPHRLAPAVSRAWRKWALWLLENIGPLQKPARKPMWTRLPCDWPFAARVFPSSRAARI